MYEFPPIVLEAAEGLYDAVHGLAFDDADVAVSSAVVVMPRREEEEIAAVALFCKSVGRMIAVGEAIVL